MSHTLDSPIFTSVEQALHVAFLIGILPASQKSQMQCIMERMMEDAGLTQEREHGTVNFGGLSALEVRAQCAMIRGAVLHRLPAHEAHAVHARYAHAALKAEGVRGVRDYCRQRVTTHGDMPSLAIAWNVYASLKQREGLSVRKIAAEYKLAPSTVGRDVQKVRETGQMLLNQAVDRLGAPFLQSNLVGPGNY